MRYSNFSKGRLAMEIEKLKITRDAQNG